MPNINDKSWNSPGPLGAAQRTLGLTTTQLAMLFGHSEDMGRELRAATAKLTEEKEANAKLQARGEAWRGRPDIGGCIVLRAHGACALQRC